MNKRRRWKAKARRKNPQGIVPMTYRGRMMMYGDMAVDVYVVHGRHARHISAAYAIPLTPPRRYTPVFMQPDQHL